VNYEEFLFRAKAGEAYLWVGPEYEVVVEKSDPACVVQGGDMLTENPAELRPPPEHADKPLHWLHSPSDRTRVFGWRDGAWDEIGRREPWAPGRLAEIGYRYLGPAEWRESTPEALKAAAQRIVNDAAGVSGEYWAERWHEADQKRETGQRRIAELETRNRVVEGLWRDALAARKILETEVARLHKANAGMAAALRNLGVAMAGDGCPGPSLPPPDPPTHTTHLPRRAMR
jgi:hypothetical protein